MKKALAQSEANNDAVKIDALGAALKRNPEYVYLESLKAAGDKGNMILMPAGQSVILQTGKK